MDPHSLNFFLQCFETFIAALIITLILIAGMFVRAWFKRTWEGRRSRTANPASLTALAAKAKGHKIRECIQVGEYEIFIHHLTEQWRSVSQQERVIYADVEYRNQTQEENMSCRRNQWHLFDQNGYSYEAKSEMGASSLYREKQYFGGDRFINPGMKARGWLAFPVPEDAKITTLQFMTAFIGTKTVDIDVESVIEPEQQVAELPMN